MSKILELREKRAKAWEAAKAFLDAKRTDDGFVSAEDAATYDKMEADVVNLGKEIERLEDRRQLMRNLQSRPILLSPISPTTEFPVIRKQAEPPMNIKERSGMV